MTEKLTQDAQDTKDIPEVVQPVETAKATAEPTQSDKDKELLLMVKQAKAQQEQFKGLAPDVLVQRLADKDEITHLRDYCRAKGYIKMRYLNNDEKKALRDRQIIQDGPAGQIARRRYSDEDLAEMKVEVDHFFGGKETDTLVYIQQGYEPILESQDGVMVHLGYKELKAYKIPAYIIAARQEAQRRESMDHLRQHQEEGRQSYDDAFDIKHVEARGHAIAATA